MGTPAIHTRSKVEILARTKWHHVSPTMIRSCLECGKPYPSTCPADRLCPDCLRQDASKRVRSALGPESAALMELIDEYFDPDIIGKTRKAREFDNKRRAAVNYELLRRQGLGKSPEAKYCLGVMKRKPAYDKVSEGVAS